MQLSDSLRSTVRKVSTNGALLGVFHDVYGYLAQIVENGEEVKDIRDFAEALLVK